MSAPLEDLIAAAREASATAPDRGRATRDRVLTSLRRRPSARRRLSAIVAAIAASVAGATAFAWYAQAPHAPIVRISDTVIVVASNAPHPAHRATTAAPTTPTPEVTPALISVPPAPAITASEMAIAPPAFVPAPIGRAPVVTPPRRPMRPTAPAPAVADRELADYAVAHRLHFQDHDCVGAVRAWDAYLTSWPSGQLAPEARFNRAVCLVKLERWPDADTALRALADDPATSRRADVDRMRAIVDARLY